MTIRCVILEDQAPARRILENYLDRLSGFETVGSAAAPSAAAAIMDAEPVDLLFLDLGLPQMDGFAFLKRRETPPVVIVTTAYSDRAVEGFTHGVADYLVKPFGFDRFKIAADRALLALQARRDSTIIAIPIERGLREFVPMRNIVSLSADGDYVSVRTTEKSLHTLGPLSKWEAKLRSPPFVRIHRSHVVNADHVELASGKYVVVGGARLPVSSTHAGDLASALRSRAAGV